MNTKRSMGAFVATLAGILAGSIAATGGANAAIVDVGDQTGWFNGVREYNLPAAKVTNWCLTKGEFDSAANQYTWNYRVTFKNTRKRTAATHISSQDTDLRISTSEKRVVVLRPKKSQTVTVAPFDVIHTTDISPELSRDLNLSRATVEATKKQMRQFRKGRAVRGNVFYDKHRSRTMPVTLTGDTMCAGESVEQDTQAEVSKGNRDSRSLIHSFTGGEMMADAYPSEYAQSVYREYRTDREAFLRTWVENSIRGWDDAAAGRPMATSTFDLDGFLPLRELSAEESAYIGAYLEAAGYYDYKNGHESRTERLAGARPSVRTESWMFDYNDGWDLAQYYEKYPYRAA